MLGLTELCEYARPICMCVIPTRPTLLRIGLALSPAETGGLSRQLMQGWWWTCPLRFEGFVRGLCLALVLANLGRRLSRGPTTRRKPGPLARKISSTVGLSELFLLGRRRMARWHPLPAGLLTLTGLARAYAFTVLPPRKRRLRGKHSTFRNPPLEQPIEIPMTEVDRAPRRKASS